MKIAIILIHVLLATFGLAKERINNSNLVARVNLPKRHVMDCKDSFPDTFHTSKHDYSPSNRTISIVTRNYVEKQGEVFVTVYGAHGAVWGSSCRYDCGPSWNRYDFQQLLGPPLIDAPLEVSAGNWCQSFPWYDASWGFDNFWIRYKDEWRNAPTNCHIWSSQKMDVGTAWSKKGHMQCNVTVDIPKVE